MILNVVIQGINPAANLHSLNCIKARPIESAIPGRMRQTGTPRLGITEHTALSAINLTFLFAVREISNADS